MSRRCKHEWLEKPSYGERWCPRCNKIEKIDSPKKEVLMYRPKP